jgi:hypothetical protein
MKKFSVEESFKKNCLLLRSLYELFPKDSINQLENKYISNELSKAEQDVRYYYEDYLTYMLAFETEEKELITLDKEFNALFPEEEIETHNNLKLLKTFEINKNDLDLSDSWVYNLDNPLSFPNKMKFPTECQFSMNTHFIRTLSKIFNSETEVKLFMINNTEKYEENKTVFDHWLLNKYKECNENLSESIDYKLSNLLNEKEIEILEDIKENYDSYINHPAIGRGGINTEILNISKRINKKLLTKKTNILVVINNQYYLL